jgi:uncharacterized protein YecE (DUF72 family)
MAHGSVRIGCSGWHYAHWAGRFYPRDLPKDEWLPYYATRFDTVELNNSFYRLPAAEQFNAWSDMVPSGFTFAVKASRYLTHFKRLIDPEEPLERLLSRALALGRHLGPILYQLPPGWVPDLARLTHFLELLPRRLPGVRGLRHVIEFRDQRGYASDVRACLARHRVALCLHDMAGSASPRVRVGPFIYLRLHGAGEKYGGGYSKRTLEAWAAWLSAVRRDGVDAFVYFNNDRDGHAVADARTLKHLLDV